jgi:hypothetical protein
MPAIGELFWRTDVGRMIALIGVILSEKFVSPCYIEYTMTIVENGI